MLAAAYAFRHLELTDGRRAQIADYLSRYGIPLNGGFCIADPACYNNLKLVDATAVLAITGLGIRAADPAALLHLRLPVAGMAAERPGRANSPSLCPTICSLTNTGTCLRPSWTAIVCPTISGKIVDVRDQVRIIRFSLAAFIASMRLISRSSTKGPFFELRLI